MAGSLDALQQLLAQRKKEAADKAALEEQARRQSVEESLALHKAGLEQSNLELNQQKFQNERMGTVRTAAEKELQRRRQEEAINALPPELQGRARAGAAGISGLPAPDYGAVNSVGGRIFTRKPGQGFEDIGQAQTPINPYAQGQLDVAKGRLAVEQAKERRAAQAGAGAGGAGDYSQERAFRVVQSVDEMLGKVNPWTTGTGSLLSILPGTESRNFAAELNTLKSNIAFNELTQMRAASKTGGALGQVSDREGQLLSDALGALDAGQTPANVKAQLLKIKGAIQRWQAAKAAAGADVAGDQTDAGGGEPSIEELRATYGY